MEVFIFLECGSAGAVTGSHGYYRFSILRDGQSGVPGDPTFHSCRQHGGLRLSHITIPCDCLSHDC